MRFRTLSTVTFNGTVGTPTSWSDTQIVVPVPSGSTTGNIVVTAGAVASNGAAFTVPVVISSLSPTSGVANTPVTITGTGFGAAQGSSTVTFNGIAAAPTTWSDTQISTGANWGDERQPSHHSWRQREQWRCVYTVGTGSYSYVRAVVLNHEQVTRTDQTDFPVLISGTFPYLASASNGGHVQNPKGYDIVFTSDAAGQTQLDHEIDSYDPVTGTAAFWVRIPLLSHTTDTTIYMWYGNSTLLESLENKPGVWRNGYAGVWHFGSSQGLNASDSTANENNAVNYGVTPSAGEIGGAGSVSSSYFQVPPSSSFEPATAVTLEAWVNPTSVRYGYPTIIALSSSSSSPCGLYWACSYAMSFGDQSQMVPMFLVNESGGSNSVTGSAIPLGQWTHLVGTYDGANEILYANGLPTASQAMTGNINYVTGNDLFIGSSGVYTWPGLLDEVRISTVARSADWIATEYGNQSNSSSFMTFCPEQSSGSQVLSCTQPVPVTSYTYIRAITIDHRQVVRTDQTDFPFLVSGTFPYLASAANGGHVQNANGYDIVFTSDAAGQNKLDHEIDSYDAVTGAAAFWVRIPLLSHTTDTTIYMWYGNSAVQLSQENKPGVWQNGYAGVWHFGSSQGLSASDSTANENNAVNYGVTPSAGEIGGAGSVSSSYFQVPPSSSFEPATAVTLEAWVNPTSVRYGYPTIIALSSSSSSPCGLYWACSYAMSFGDQSQMVPMFLVNESGGSNSVTGSAIPLGQWTHLVGTYDGANEILYANGLPTASQAMTGNINYVTGNDLFIGSSGVYTWPGLLDEVRISTVARSADWIATEYGNQSNSSSFMTFCPEQSSGSQVLSCTQPVPVTSYTYIRAITIDHRQVVRTDQTDFPFLVSGTFPYLASAANGGHVQNANGYDIVFTSDAAGQNRLDHEIDSYDAVTGAAAFWVRIPLLSHTTDTTIYMWYGNSAVQLSQENKPGVWQNGYAGVWHFGSSQGLSASDSTANENNAINNGVTATTGAIGGAGSFNGSTFLKVPSSNTFKPAGALSLEAWVMPANVSTNHPDVISLTGAAETNQAYALKFGVSWVPELDVTVNSQQFRMMVRFQRHRGNGHILSAPMMAVTWLCTRMDCLWEHRRKAVVFDYGTSTDLGIGSAWWGPRTTRWGGSQLRICWTLDEVRISTVARSADWIATEYNNQSSTETPSWSAGADCRL